MVGRGGLLTPMPGGTYIVTDAIIDDLQRAVQGEHASNLGAIIAKCIADAEGIPAYIVDPVATDELDDIARISGMPELERLALGHALNIKAVGRRAAKRIWVRNSTDVDFLLLILAEDIGFTRKEG